MQQLFPEEVAMDYILTKMNEQTWMIDNNGTRIFILEGQERTMVIDSGMTLPETRQIAGSLSDKPLMLCNTHADIDHISGNDAFDTVYMHPSELVFYNHTGKHTHRIKALYEGDVIDLGDRKVEIIEIPGHTCGCIAFLDRKYRVLISGDSIQNNSRIFMFGPYRDLTAYNLSFEHLKKWHGLYDEIWPSHGDLPLTEEMIDILIKDVMKIKEGIIQGTTVDIHGEQAVAYKSEHNVYLLDR